MNKKLNNIKEMKYYTDFNLVGEKIIQWRTAKPQNESLKEIYFAWQEIGFYVNNLITEQRAYNQSLSEYRADKIRAVNRARKADERIEELEKEINKYKALYG